jgi:hypothetical protein
VAVKTGTGFVHGEPNAVFLRVSLAGWNLTGTPELARTLQDSVVSRLAVYKRPRWVESPLRHRKPRHRKSRGSDCGMAFRDLETGDGKPSLEAPLPSGPGTSMKPAAACTDTSTQAFSGIRK